MTLLDLNKNQTHVNTISAPMGGFGNHIRWLVLLDKKFKLSPLEAVVWNQAIFDNIKGPDWPIFSNYESMPEFVKQECINELGIFVNIAESIDDKMNFILDNVYNNSRSWHNWLAVEFTYRGLLNQIISFNHDRPPSDRCLKVTVDPVLAYKCYVKFNSSLTNRTKENFIDLIKHGNAAVDGFKYCIDATCLFSEILDKTFYSNICQIFNIDDNYKYACKIHKQWYNLHLKSEKEIVSDLTKLYC